MSRESFEFIHELPVMGGVARIAIEGPHLIYLFLFSLWRIQNPISDTEEFSALISMMKSGAYYRLRYSHISYTLGPSFECV